MGKTLKIILLILFLFALTLDCYANTYQDELNDFISKTPVNDLKISAEDFGYESIYEKFDLGNVISVIIGLFNSFAKDSFPMFISLLTIIIAFQIINNLNFNREESLSTIISNVSLCAVITICIEKINQNIYQVEDVIEKAKIFSSAAVPAVVAISASAGKSLSSVVFSSAVSITYSLFQYISSGILLPLLTFFITIGITDNFTDKFDFLSLCNVIKKWINGIIVAFVGLFSLSITVQNILTSTNDTFVKRSIRYAVAKLIPLVGTSLSGGLETMFALASTAGTTMSIFGMLVIFALFLPAICANLFYGFIISVCKYISNFFELYKLSNVFSVIANSFYLLCAIISACAFLLIASFLVVCLNMR